MFVRTPIFISRQRKKGEEQSNIKRTSLLQPFHAILLESVGISSAIVGIRKHKNIPCLILGCMFPFYIDTKYSLHWVLRPPSSQRSRSLNPIEVAKSPIPGARWSLKVIFAEVHLHNGHFSANQLQIVTLFLSQSTASNPHFQSLREGNHKKIRW